MNPWRKCIIMPKIDGDRRLIIITPTHVILLDEKSYREFDRIT